MSVPCGVFTLQKYSIICTESSKQILDLASNNSDYCFAANYVDHQLITTRRSVPRSPVFTHECKRKTKGYVGFWDDQQSHLGPDGVHLLYDRNNTAVMRKDLQSIKISIPFNLRSILDSESLQLVFLNIFPTLIYYKKMCMYVCIYTHKHTPTHTHKVISGVVLVDG